MKTVLGIVGFVLFVSPSLAQQKNNKQALASAIHLRQMGGVRADYGNAYLSAQKSFQPKSIAREREQALCSTAHDFCPDYHGDNG